MSIDLDFEPQVRKSYLYQRIYECTKVTLENSTANA